MLFIIKYIIPSFKEECSTLDKERVKLKEERLLAVDKFSTALQEIAVCQAKTLKDKDEIKELRRRVNA